MTLKKILIPAMLALAASCLWSTPTQADVFAASVVDEGTAIVATSNNLVLTRPDNTKLKCTSTTVHFELTDDGTEHLQLEQLGAATAEGCELNREEVELPNLAVTMDDGTFGFEEGSAVTLDTWGEASANMVISWTVFGGPFTHESHTGILAANCSHEGGIQAAVNGGGSDQLSIEGTLGGSCGEGAIQGDFTLESSSGDPISVHYVETPGLVELADEEGSVEEGAPVTATSEDFVMTQTDEARVECEELTFHFKVVDPGTEHLELEQVEGPATSKGCLLNREALELANLPMTVQDGTLAAGEEGIVTVDTDGAMDSSLTFKGEFFTDAEHETKIAECHYGGSLGLQAAKSGSDELMIESSSVDGSPCAKGDIDGKFTLETANGEPVSVNY